ncbi:hypothetical protein B0F90DRAFT_567849 [Multifurca ochricompacta]|uniref:Uncharacterized protein n=1 Tax=Multifurca ochricompacta TaxID=376703 RepID=A0AAD4QN24_9AGAM|nr:hypothetical protein B0F90DRAFT_567849 [Multifurca ochricompacta]
MGAYYDEIEIEDMAWDEEMRVFHYPVHVVTASKFRASSLQITRTSRRVLVVVL